MARAEALPRPLLARTLLATATCMLPLLLQMPAVQAWLIAATGAAAAAIAWRRPLPGWLRLLATLALVGTVLGNAGMQLGRDTACALLLAMLALKPTETRSLRDARSLLGFALFAPFATFLLDQGPMSMLLAVIATALVLMNLAQLSNHESGIGPAQGTPSPWRGVLRLALLGLPLALATFWLFPRLASPLWGVPERAMTRTGLSDEMSPGDWVDMMVDDTPALRAQFNGPEPQPQQLYWRGPVLWHYDGRSWRALDRLRGQPAGENQLQRSPQATRWSYRIELEPTERRQVIALDLPLDAPDELLRNIEQGLYSLRPLTALTRWELTSAEVASFDAQLPQAQRDAALQLPEGFNPRARELAARWRAAHGDDDAAIVNASLAMVRAEFAYTLAVPLLGRNAVDEFLFEEKAGFCEHYSSAFVFLMRAAGIPARVVTGYAGGYRNPFGNYWLVRRSDAHAWAEVWLEGRGWVRVDPTAAVAPERIFDTIADRRGADGGALAALAQAGDFGDWLRRGWNDWLLGYNAARQQQLLRPLGIERVDGMQLAWLFTLVALLAIGLMLWLGLRQRAHHDRLLQAWHSASRRYARLGLQRLAHETASDWAARVANARPEAPASAELLRLAAGFTRLRYALPEVAAQQRNELIRELRHHRP